MQQMLRLEFAVHREAPGAQTSTKARHLIGIKFSIIAKGVEKSRELTANLLEDFLVATGHGVAGTSKDCPGIEGLEKGTL